MGEVGCQDLYRVPKQSTRVVKMDSRRIRVIHPIMKNVVSREVVLPMVFIEIGVRSKSRIYHRSWHVVVRMSMVLKLMVCTVHMTM